MGARRVGVSCQMNELSQTTVILLHGFASSANSRKAEFFEDKIRSVPGTAFYAIEFNPTPADFEYMTITGMINRLRQFLFEGSFPNVQIIGSSMGALVGLNYSYRYGDVERLMLLAPALAYGGLLEEEERRLWKMEGSRTFQHYAFEKPCPLRYDMQLDGQQYASWVPPVAPVTIIHGRNDDVVSIEDSRDYSAAYQDYVELVEVDSDHRLSDKLDFIWEQVLRHLPGSRADDR